MRAYVCACVWHVHNEMCLFQMSLPSQKVSQLSEFRSALLRPVVTGNWGCGAFGGDPQLKAMLQWMAVSLSGRPELVYCTFHSRQLQMVRACGRSTIPFSSHLQPACCVSPSFTIVCHILVSP